MSHKAQYSSLEVSGSADTELSPADSNDSVRSSSRKKWSLIIITICLVAFGLLVSFASKSAPRLVRIQWTVHNDIAETIVNDDGADAYWGATEMACVTQAYESADPYGFSCDKYIGITPDNKTCADPDQYMVDRCRNEPWCSALCPQDLERHTVALCAFTALSNMTATCEWVDEQLHSSVLGRRQLRSSFSSSGSSISPKTMRIESEEIEETSNNEANEVMCDRVAYCNLCGTTCRKLINPTMRMHHLASMVHGREDDDGKAAWIAIPLLRHLPKLCSCLR